MKRKTILSMLAISLSVLISVPRAFAQQQFVYPQKGQSAEHQKKDEYECHSWAMKQTGFNPTQAAQAPQQQQVSSQHSAKQQNYLKARAACLEGKGYSVK